MYTVADEATAKTLRRDWATEAQIHIFDVTLGREDSVWSADVSRFSLFHEPDRANPTWQDPFVTPPPIGEPIWVWFREERAFDVVTLTPQLTIEPPVQPIRERQAGGADISEATEMIETHAQLERSIAVEQRRYLWQQHLPPPLTDAVEMM